MTICDSLGILRTRLHPRRRFRDAEEEARDLGLDSDDEGVVREATPPVQEELGPPLELSAPFVPRPDADSLWLARVCNCGCWASVRAAPRS